MKNTKLISGVKKSLSAGIAAVMLICAIPAMSMAATKKAQCCSIEDRHNYSVSTRTSSTWDNHSIVEITIKNEDKIDWYNWSIMFQTPYSIDNIWNASVDQHDSDGIYVINNAGWNKKIAKGTSVTFGVIFSSDTDKKVQLSNDWYFLIVTSNEYPDNVYDLPYKVLGDRNDNGRKDYYDLLAMSSYSGYIPEEKEDVSVNPGSGDVIENNISVSYENVAFNVFKRQGEVTIHATVNDNTDATNCDLSVYDDEGYKIGTLVDDGNIVTNGDIAAGDGIYSCKCEIKLKADNNLYVKMGDIKSDSLYISFDSMAPKTDEEDMDFLCLCEIFDDCRDEVQNYSLDKKLAKYELVLNHLTESLSYTYKVPMLKAESIRFVGTTVYAETYFGLVFTFDVMD